MTAPWTACGATFCLGTAALDLGSADLLTAPAAGDYDGDGITEQNADEYTGLVGTTPTVVVEQTPGAWTVLSINGVDYAAAGQPIAEPSPSATPAG